MAYNSDTTTDAVREGMEILVWQVDWGHWNQLGVATAVTNRRKQHARSLGWYTAIATIAIYPLLAFLILPSEEVAIGFVFNIVLLPIVAVAGYAFTLRTIRRALGPDLPLVRVPPRVLLTSNGISVGGRTWQWRGECYRLASVELHGDNPVKLRLDYRGTGWRRVFVRETIDIPFPKNLAHDLTELKDLLDVKTRLTG